MIVTNPKTGEQFNIQRKDLTGKTIHGNKVHGIAYQRGNNWYWYVTCRCGEEGKVKSSLSLDKGQGCNHCIKPKKQTVTNPETGVSVRVTSVFEDLTGQTINDKYVIGPVRTIKNRLLWDVRCHCGNRYQTQSQSLKLSRGCRQCAFKDDRPHRRLRPYEALYNAFKYRAKVKVLISYDDFVEIATTNPTCHYCDSPLVWAAHNLTRSSSASNLDRKDPSQPYQKENIVSCCIRCNKAKLDHFTYNEWVEIAQVIKSW